MENRAKKRRKKVKIQNAVLAVLGTAGAISVAMVAPNIFQALPHLMGKENYKLKFKAKNAVERLIIKEHVKRNSRGLLEITAQGRRHIAIEQARASAPAQKKRRWDKQFRLVMFDIPEGRKHVRDRLRMLMHQFGFLRLQNSVWISPYDCEDLIALVKSELRIGKDVLYAVVDQLENDRWVRDHFGLK